MKKEEICVKITNKNRNKVKEILEMFGEETYNDQTLERDYIVFSSFSTRWVGVYYKLDYELIKPKKLKEMLAKEHLKEGDVIFVKTEFGFNTTVKVTCINDSFFKAKSDCLVGNFQYKDFIRYVTEEEKELLEPKKQPLLKSEDGFDLFVGDNYHIVYFEKQQNEWGIGDYFNLDNHDFVIRYKEILKAFKHKESALKWIEKQNKPESNYEFRISVAGEDLGSWSPAELTDEITNFKLLLREKGYKATLKIEKL